jgi:subtilisin family serine protease
MRPLPAPAFLAVLALLPPTMASALVIRRPDPGVAALAPRAPKPAALPAILVCFNEDAAVQRLDRDRLAPNAATRSVLDRHGLPGMTALTTDAAGGRFARLDISGYAGDVGALMAELRATGQFRAVCPDLRMTLTLNPDDPYLGNQWQAQELPNDADIQLPAAWDVATGSPAVEVAIMDTGVDLTHEDLQFSIATNPGETPGNGIDDDMNGFIDDVTGWDFGSGDSDAHPEAFFDASGLDAGFHGSFCAGLAAAPANNGVGIAGAGFNTRILPIKVSANDDIPLSAVTAGFGYAVLRQPDILSLSFGATGDEARDYFQALVDMATSAGICIIASAGNDTSDVPVYPAACNGVLSVAATDDTNARAFFSNYGSWVDVAAPGAWVWSTIAWNYDVDFGSEFFYYLFFEYDGLTPYMRGDGTSFSAPLVAGVAALVKAQNPGLPPAALQQHLITTGDAVAYDLPIGKKVNAFRAVTTPVSGVSDEAAPRVTAIAAAPNPFTRATRLSFDVTTAGPVRVSIVDVTGRLVRTLHDGTLAAGAQVLTWDGVSDAGVSMASGVYLARVEVPGRTSFVRVVRTK